MSSSIWMECGGASELRPLRLAPWRVVEAQHKVSTRKLVGTAAEQELLEELIDSVKPATLAGRRLHYLLFTPFRYPPLRYGSRFGARHEGGIWYGSEKQGTAFAEVAYYRLLFLEGSHAELGSVTTSLTAFTVRMRSSNAVDLCSAPFDEYRSAIASPVSYVESQALGRAMRDSGVELFRFPSARDSSGGASVGAFSPAVFHNAKPLRFETWHCTAVPSFVEFARGDFGGRREVFVYGRAQFEVDGRLPSPAV